MSARGVVVAALIAGGCGASSTSAPGPSSVGHLGCGSPQDCYAQGIAMVADDPDAAAIAWDRACNGGHPEACTELAQLLGERENPRGSLALHEQGCRLGSGPSCRGLGDAYRLGTQVARDLALAAVLYRTGCDHGDLQSCMLLGQMYFLGQGTDLDYIRAAEIWVGLCEGEVTMGCASLAYLFEQGFGVPQNRKHAQALYQIACDHGDTGACRDLKRLHGQQD